MRETKNLEFKETVTNTFLKTVSAYANYGTGKIEFGRRYDGSIAGIKDVENTCLNIENMINEKRKLQISVDKKKYSGIFIHGDNFDGMISLLGEFGNKERKFKMYGRIIKIHNIQYIQQKKIMICYP